MRSPASQSSLCYHISMCLKKTENAMAQKKGTNKYPENKLKIEQHEHHNKSGVKLGDL